MNPDLADLYQELILDHGRSPRNHHPLECPPAHSAEGFNPFCGDKITVFVNTSEGRIEDVSFVGEGCAISQAAASMLTEAVRGKPLSETRELISTYTSLLSDHDTAPEGGSGGDGGEGLKSSKIGKLEVLLGVKRFPMRVKCATLAAHTLKAALEGTHEPVTTE